MRKLFKNWIFVFLISVFLLMLLFYYGLYKLEASPPSKDWSRGINISEVSMNMVKNFDHINVVALPIPSDNIFITIWETDNTLNYSIINKEGTKVHKGKINYIFPEFTQIGAVLSTGKINIYGTSERNLNCYMFDYKEKIITAIT
jgi:hypothetical protein